MDYDAFLASKQLTDPPTGIEVTPDAISPVLYPFQQALVRWALRRGRAGLFAHTGLGKGLCLLEWAEHIPGPVLILAPLQLEVIKRCIRLWSNPSDIIADPFAGLGSTGYVALQHERRFVGCELKASYAQTAIKNLTRALETQKQQSLF